MLREKNVRGQSLKQTQTRVSKDKERRSVYQNPSHNCSPRYQTRAPEANVQKEQISVKSKAGTLR